MKLRPATFFVPAVFLLILGVGNITVGAYKSTQYRDVLRELSSIKANPGLSHPSPMRRIQLANDAAYRLYLRKKSAVSRRDFYRLVKFGGKVFIGLSLPLFLMALTLRWRSRANSQADQLAAFGVPEPSK